MNVNQEPDDLLAAERDVMQRSTSPDAEEWAIFDYEGFGPLRLDEYESLETVAKLAQGIAKHGPAFAAWAQYVGVEHHEQFGHFDDHFRGEHDNTEDYVREVLDSAGLYHDLDDALKAISEDFRRHIDVDVAALARDLEAELHVVEQPNGRVWVFEP